MSKYRVLFYMFFGIVYANQFGQVLEWDTKEEAERWAKANCGPNVYEVRHVVVYTQQKEKA